MKRRQTGYTLVEIAIVLVIAGLVMACIVKAQEMLTQAKIRNVAAEFSGIAAAYNAYQDRYRAIPGDDPQAGTRWQGATSGNGDGVLAGKYNSTVAADESRLWWDHLRRGGFIAGNDTRQPLNAVTGMIGVQTGNAAGGPSLGTFSGLIVCSASLPDKIAIAVDTQLDDGYIATGTVRGQKDIGGQNPDINAIADASAYAETGANFYTLCRAM